MKPRKPAQAPLILNAKEAATIMALANQSVVFQNLIAVVQLLLQSGDAALRQYSDALSPDIAKVEVGALLLHTMKDLRDLPKDATLSTLLVDRGIKLILLGCLLTPAEDTIFDTRPEPTPAKPKAKVRRGRH